MSLLFLFYYRHYRICAVTGCFLALALKFAGSANNAAFRLMVIKCFIYQLFTAPQLSTFGVFLVRIFPYSD